MQSPYFVIDFDSTFTRVEALDVLADIVLAHSGRKAEVLRQIQEITNRGMEGELDFRASLTMRLDLLRIHHDDVVHLANQLKEQISPSFLRNQPHFVALRERVYVVSNGFTDFIAPVVEHYGLKADHVFANEFLYDERGFVTGFNADSPLSRSGGKSQVIRDLRLTGDVYVIGDGFNDLEIRKAGYANKFYLFTENVEREKVKPEADHIAPNVDEILYELKMNRALSYPRNRIRVLLLDAVDPQAAAFFEQEGYQVELSPTPLSEEELSEKIRQISVLGVGPNTRVSRRVISSARRLINIGIFGIHTGRVDLEACTEHGVAVFNAPFADTRSVVELTLAHIILLSRQLPDTLREMHEGRWARPAVHAREVRGRRLGIVGYGNIGSQLSVLAESLGLEVYFFDITDKLPLGNARRCNTLDELLATADIISLHVEPRPENNGLIGKAQFERMKDGVLLLNLACGSAVDEHALREAILSGKVGGCAIDVFENEPRHPDEPFGSPLVGLPNTLLTPHIGGHTVEAQAGIARFVPQKIVQYINTGNTTGSVNLPNLHVPPLQKAHRLLHIHHNVPNVVAQIDGILARHNINILGQYLKTNAQVGYVITDVDQEYSETLLGELREVQATIWFRVLY